MNMINRQKLTFIGYIARSKGLGNDILTGMVCRKRRKGRLKRKLENDIEEVLGMSMAELLWHAQDRESWRTII